MSEKQDVLDEVFIKKAWLSPLLDGPNTDKKRVCCADTDAGIVILFDYFPAEMSIKPDALIGLSIKQAEDVYAQKLKTYLKNH